MRDKGNEPAFPHDNEAVMFKNGHEECAKKILAGFHPGLTKRELAAMMVMQGMISSCITDDMTADKISKEACIWADALLEALDQ